MKSVGLNIENAPALTTALGDPGRTGDPAKIKGHATLTMNASKSRFVKVVVHKNDRRAATNNVNGVHGVLGPNARRLQSVHRGRFRLIQ